MANVLKAGLYGKENEDLKEIDLANAQNFNNSKPKDFPVFYKNSGLKYFIGRFLDQLNEEMFPLESIFIENSTITTATEEGKLSAFTAFWEENSTAERAKKVFQTQQKVIRYLQTKYANVFWHPDFFIAPGESLAYYTILEDHEARSYGPQEKPLITGYKKAHTEISIDEFDIEPTEVKNTFGFNSLFEMNYSDIISNKSTRVSEQGLTVDVLHSINHKLYYNHFQKDTETKKQSVFISIPILCPYASGIPEMDNFKTRYSNREGQMFAGLGAVFIYLQFQEDISANKEILDQELNKLVLEIFSKAKDYASFYSFSSAYLKAEQAKMQATKAAISQVMARNMSHNIGSHVISKFVTKKDVEDILGADHKNASSPYKPLNGLNTNLSQHEILAWFNSYLRNRMDYLADIATGMPAMEVTRPLVAEIIAGFDKNRILLNRISGVENFRFSIEIRDCRNCKENCEGEACKLNGKDKDLPISIPNDVMGYHALYIIIENLIRNTAKHGGASNQKITTFILEIRDSPVDNSLYEIILYDTVQKTGTYTLNERDKKDLRLHNNCKEAPSDTMKEIDWLVYHQNRYLNQSVLDENNALRQGAWGLIEMDVSAAYLRKIAPEDSESSKYDIEVLDGQVRKNIIGKCSYLNILKAINKNNSLGYRFHLLKPKEMVIVDETGNWWRSHSKEKLYKLKEYGILILHTNEKDQQDETNEWLFDVNKTYPHPFLMVIAGDAFSVENYLYNQIEVENITTLKKEKIRLFRSNLPARLLVCSDKNTSKSRWVAWLNKDHDIFDSITNGTFTRDKDPFNNNTILDWAWKIWLKNKLDYFSIQLEEVNINLSKYIYDGSNNNHKKKYSIMLDDHGSNPDGMKNKYYEIYTSQTENLVKEKIQDELYESENAINNNFDKSELFKFADGIFTKVLILDERVQNASEKYYVPINTKGAVPINIRKLLEKVNVIIPQEDLLDLNRPTFEVDYEEKIKRCINLAKNPGRSATNLDFIVIHLGIIEKVLQTSPYKNHGKGKNEILKFIHRITENADNEGIRVIITSGRGRPDNLPNEVPFIGYSIISQYCIENRFKSFLNQALQQARPVK